MNDATVKIDRAIFNRIKLYAARNGQTITGYLNKILLWSIEYDEMEEKNKDAKKIKTAKER